MKKPIKITDLAQLGHALECRAHITGAEMIEAFHTAPRLSYDMASQPARNVVMSGTSNDGVIWYDEVNAIDDQTWEKLRSRTPIGVWITGADETFKIDNPNT